jgi:uncharacterized BrkB/YihY/UPF0761 family membrane protein
MGYVMPAATASAMATMPAQKAGAGAALINSLRQVGGALGVAVLGSLLSSHYRDQIHDHLRPLPAQIRSIAEESLDSTLAVATQLGPSGAGLASHAMTAFVSAMRVTSLAAAGVMLLGTFAVFVFLPRRRPDPPAKEVTGSPSASRATR